MIHSEDPRVAQLPKAVREALAQSNTFGMELLPDITTKMTFAKSTAYGDEYALAEAISQSLFDHMSPLMLQRGIPTQTLIKLKPWAVYMTLNTPPAQTGRALDLTPVRKSLTRR